MARPTPKAQPAAPDYWVLALFVACVVALLSGGFLSSAILSQTQFSDAWAMLAGVAGLVGCAAVLASGFLVFPRTRLGLAWTLFLAWAGVAAFSSGRALNAFMGEPTNLLGLWTLLAISGVIVGAALRGKAAQGLLERWSPWVLAIQVGFSALGLVLVAGNPPINWDLAARGTLPNSSALGEAVLLLLPWTVARVKPASKMTAAQKSGIAAAVASIVTLAVGRSRIALAVAVLWAAWIVIERSALAEKTRRLALGGLISVAVLLVAGYVALQVGVPGGGQLGLRPEFTRIGVKAIAASPVVGYGPDGFIVGGASVSTRESVDPNAVLVFSRGATDPHNILLWVGLSTGVVGLALFAWALVELVLAWRARANAGVDVSAGVWAVVGALVVFATAPATLSLLPLFGFVLGASIAGRPREPLAGAKHIAGFGLLGVLALGSLALTANALTRLPIDNPNANVSARLAPQAQQAADTWRVDPYLYYLASLHWGWAAQTDPTVATARPDLVAIKRGTQIDSHDPLIALETARTLRFYREAPASVVSAFEEAIARWPLHPVARVELALYLAEQGDTAKAKQVVEPLEGLNLNDPSLMAEVEKLMNRPSQAPQ